ncbi:Metal Ion (Mn2 -iron) Transporter (Nramp) Family [Thraustotheca clavata]|uniref:Metal Ion (Mn2-iron) Transporter (Nramp) Family n=1 Tax=Thraustotheca clavata TaxID=74557 RepID=A0A1V9ZYU6_9STRA|nr:Metal Ion (Mn2 -iron) Transporter (Nramp) Family [Thraustotheca clavata]
MASVFAISQRLDKLPTNRGCGGISPYYLKLLHSAGVGWAMDSMDTFLFIYCINLITDEFKAEYNRVFSHSELGILSSAVFAGSFVGSFLFGHMADTYGRKPMFMWTMVTFGFGTIMCAVADSYGMLLTFRFIAGIGLGGELPVATTLVQELSPKATRGRIIVILDGFWPIGSILAILLARELTKCLSWRWVFALSTLPVVYALTARMFVPESPKWLASVGRIHEAEAIVRSIEADHAIYNAANAPKPDGIDEMTADVFCYRQLTTSQRVALLFRGVYLRRSMVLWFVWLGLSFAYFAIYTWLPTIVAEKSDAFDINGSTWTLLCVVICQIPGYFAAAYIVEIIGRKLTLLVFLLGSFIAAIVFGYVAPTEANLLVSGGFLSFFMLGSWGALYAYTPENYPTNVRAMGAAYPAGISRIGAIGGSYILPILSGNGWSPTSIMWLNGGVLVACSVVLFVFGYETRGKNIDDVSGFDPIAQVFLMASEVSPLLSAASGSRTPVEMRLSNVSLVEWAEVESLKGEVEAPDEEINSTICGFQLPFSWKTLWAYAGPGWLMSIAYVDPGNLESDLQAGAYSRYQLIWVLLGATVMGFFLQTLSARLGVVTGKHLAEVCREMYPRWASYILWIMTEIAIVGSDIQEVLGSAIALQILFGLPLWAGCLVTGVDTLTFLSLHQFGIRKLEAFFVALIAVMLCCFCLNLVQGGVEPAPLLEGFLPRQPEGYAITQAVGILGAVIMPHNFYLHSGLVQSRAVDRFNSKKVHEANKYFTIESGVALFVSFLINLAVMCVFAKGFFSPDCIESYKDFGVNTACVPALVSGGKSYGPCVLVEGTSTMGICQEIGLSGAGYALKGVLTEYSETIWAIGLLAAGQSSTMAGTYAGQFVMEGFLRIQLAPWKRVALTRAVALVPALAVAIWSDTHPGTSDTIGEMLNVLQSIQLPFALLPLLYFTGHTDLMGSFANSKMMKWIGWGSALMVCFVNLYLVVQKVNVFDINGVVLVVVALVALSYISFLGYLVHKELQQYSFYRK